MGLPVRIVAFGTAPGVLSSIRAAFDSMAAYEDIFSDYRADSELRRVQPQASRRKTPVSQPLFEVLTLADRLFRASGGAFDPTVGGLTRLWRQARGSGVRPDSAALRDASLATGWEGVSLDKQTHTLSLADSLIELDLGGIAKGYILDRAAQGLEQAGITAFLIEAGGDIRVGRAPPGEPGWFIGIGTRIDTVANIAIATSGDSEQFVELNGKRYSHLIDPRSGQPLQTVDVVTIAAPSAAVADGLATALRVGGAAVADGLLSAFPGSRVVAINPAPR